ncbi:MAG: methylenetetrahydrofolate reductase [Methyloligellaceae bacterium]
MLQDASLERASTSAGCDIDVRQAVIDMVAGYSIECTPAAAKKLEELIDSVPSGASVYITFLPGTDYKDTVAVAKRLKEAGLEPVPHVSARSLPNEAALEDYLKRATDDAGVRHVLAIAGAPAAPIGDYSDTLQILGTGLFDKYGIQKIGVAGHPESCPDCSDDTLMDALKWKQAYADRSDAHLHIVTQFCFEAEPLIAYEALLRREGITMPIHVGLPGVATIKTLLQFAMTCGVGNSIQFVRRQAQNVTKLLKPQAPDKLVADLARHVAGTPQSTVERLHFFPLGGFLKSATWANAIAAGRFELDAEGGGLIVEAR